MLTPWGRGPQAMDGPVDQMFGGLWGSAAILLWILAVGFPVACIWLGRWGPTFWYAEGGYLAIVWAVTFRWAAYRRKEKPGRWPIGRRWWTRAADHLEDAVTRVERALFWPAVFAAGPIWALSGIYFYRYYRTGQARVEFGPALMYAMLDLLLAEILTHGVRVRRRRSR